MLPLGHLASALAAAEFIDGDRLAASLTSQFPDLVDKPMAWVFNRTSSSRFVGHTLLVAGTVSSLAWILGGRRVMRGVLAGYASHLMGDQLIGGRLPLLWPFRQHRLGHKRFRLKPRTVLIELAAAAYLYRRWSGASG